MLIKKEILSEDQLNWYWIDPSVPNMHFTFKEQTIDECEFIDGVYYASYETFDNEQEREFNISSVSDTYTITVPAGIYGLLENSEIHQ